MKDQMKKSLVQKLSYWSGVIVIGVLVGLSLQLARAAWSEPTAPAPGGNVEAPLNISAIDQTKSGSLQLNGLALTKTDKALIIPNGNVGVGTINPNPSKGLAGYLSAKDVYLNDIGQWASSLSGGGGGTLAGGGTTNYIPKWTGGTTLGNSIMRDQGADGVFIFNASGGAVTAISTSTMAAVYGLNGNTGNGVTGWSVGGGNGVYGNGDIGIYGQGTRWAGYFQGKVKISGMGNGLSFPDGTVQTTAATAPPPPPPPPPANLNAFSCVGTNSSLTFGTSLAWTSYSGGNSTFPHCGMICTPLGWRQLAPCGDYY